MHVDVVEIKREQNLNLTPFRAPICFYSMNLLIQSLCMNLHVNMYVALIAYGFWLH